MQSEKARETAMSQMKTGKNCCQSVIYSVLEVSGIDVPEGLLEATSLMGHGMHCGATCGAFAGMQIASGLVFHNLSGAERRQLSKRLHEVFTKRYGTVNCSEIRQKQKDPDGKKVDSCVQLTGFSAAVLLNEWKEWQKSTIKGTGANAG